MWKLRWLYFLHAIATAGQLGSIPTCTCLYYKTMGVSTEVLQPGLSPKTLGYKIHNVNHGITDILKQGRGFTCTITTVFPSLSCEFGCKTCMQRRCANNLCVLAILLMQFDFLCLMFPLVHRKPNRLNCWVCLNWRFAVKLNLVCYLP